MLKLVEIGGFIAEISAFFIAGMNYAEKSYVGMVIFLLFGFYLATYVGFTIQRRERNKCQSKMK